ncbi:MAG: hypothetical protein NTX25_08600 [Proteobacteria bacterium]|nr:hypothetical protein [Pseudomonadota bacterium]
MKKSRTKFEFSPGPVRSFADLIGFEAELRNFAELLRSDRLSQVLLFEGRPAIGKRMLLAKLAALIFCETQSACAQCPACLRVIHGHEADLLWIETSGAFKVSEAELVQEHLAYQANARSYRVVVITDIEEMTDQAANRLLKTLEEPPAGSLILLSCSRPQQLLPTIRSRLLCWRLMPAPLELSIPCLQAKAEAAGLMCDARDAQSYLERSGFALGQAWQLLQKMSALEQSSIKRLNELLLKTPDGQELQEIQELLKQQGWKANELAQHFELLLNQYYKASLGLSPGSPALLPDSRQIRQRRRILQQIYRAGGSTHNYLNVQLAAEALVSASAL